MAYLDAMAQSRSSGLRNLYPDKPCITVGMGTCGRAAGADAVFETLVATAHAKDLDVVFKRVGCRGLCWAEPLVSVALPAVARVSFGNVTPEFATTIVEGVACGRLPQQMQLLIDTVDHWPLLSQGAAANTLVSSPLLHESQAASLSQSDIEELPGNRYLAFQKRIVTGNCGLIDPLSLDEYCAVGGYAALQRSLFDLTPQAVIDLVEQSGLRGRGGAGYPTGNKWRQATNGDASKRYFILNVDEGDPGAYMDRTLLEGDPFRIVESVTIGSYAIGAQEAFVFVRAEYPHAVASLQAAIDVAQTVGLLGQNILGSDYSLKIRIVLGAGAYICGEETALIRLLENRPCTPRPRPPYPTTEGLWGQPTCVNNVETMANIPFIILHGFAAFAAIGTPTSAGTKVFSLVGNVERPGLVEVALGTSIKTLVCDLGGNDSFKAVQIGGPSGVILPASLAGLPIDFESLEAESGFIGSGGIIVLRATQCIVDTVSYFLEFSARESCGSCEPCAKGIQRCADILDRLTRNLGAPADLLLLKTTAKYTKTHALCGLGKSAMHPLLSALHYFQDEFEEHVAGHCNALVCRDLLCFSIIETRCQGERCCLQTCPGNAIRGSFGKPGKVIDRLCTKCWMCTETCPYGAIQVSS